MLETFLFTPLSRFFVFLSALVGKGLSLDEPRQINFSVFASKEIDHQGPHFCSFQRSWFASPKSNRRILPNDDPLLRTHYRTCPEFADL